MTASELAGGKRQQAAALQSSAEEFAEFDESFHAFAAAEAHQPGPVVLPINSAKRVRDVLKRRHGQRCDYTANLRLKCNAAGRRRLQATESAPTGVPSGWLTSLLLDKSGIIGYNSAVRSDKALRACRVCYVRKSSFVFAFLPVVSASKYSREVEECKSKGRWADGQVGRSLSRNWTPIADRKRRTAGRKAAAGPQRLDSSTDRLRNRGNKARMSMKTKDKVKKSKSQGVEELRSCQVQSQSSPHASALAWKSAANSSIARLLESKIVGTKPECI